MRVSRSSLSALLGAALAVVVAARWIAPSADPRFVRRDGERFVVGGRAFRFVGANVDAMHGPRERRAASRVLDALTADRLGVARVWALGEAEGPEAWRDDFAFRRGPGGWIAGSYAHLDRVLAAARSRGLRVILVLANRWEDYGGFPAYLRWTGAPARGRTLRAGELRRVYTDRAVERAWRDHVGRLVTRTNAVTGVAYRDDPTVMAWELVNEGGALTCESGDRMVEWVDRQARFIHERDPNHLVGAGHGGYASAQGRAIWRRVNALESVDYADHHAYFDHDANVDVPADLWPWLADRVAVAHDLLHKPLIIGEVGFSRAAFDPAERGRWYEAFLAAAECMGVSGVAAWVYQPWSEQDNTHGIFAWGPHASENEPTRLALRDAASRCAGPLPSASPRPAPAIARLHEHDPMFVQDDWVTSAGGTSLAVDPWSLEEGCAQGPEAWIELPIRWPAEGGSELEVSLSSSAIGSLGLTITLDDLQLGRIDAPGQRVRARVSRRWGELRWLRVASTTPPGRALLARYGVDPPGTDVLMLRLR